MRVSAYYATTFGARGKSGCQRHILQPYVSNQGGVVYTNKQNDMNNTTSYTHNYLRMYRKARGLKQTDVAKLMDLVDASRISKWECDECLPSTENLFQLAAICHTMVDALFIDTVRAVREQIRQRENAIHRTSGVASESEHADTISEIAEN